MGVEGCGKCMKYSMFASNMLIMIGSVVIFSIGLWILLDRSYLENFLGTNLYKSSASIMIAIGVIVMLISFLGCFGAIREIKCMLITYFLILFLMFVILLIGGVLAYVFKDKVEDTVRTEMSRKSSDYGDPGKKGKVITNAWDNVQRHFQCCGVSKMSGEAEDKSWEVWKNNKNVGKGLPPSCCKIASKCGNQTTTFVSDAQYRIGCVNSVASYLKGKAQVLGGVGVGISAVMILGMIFSVALFKMIE